MSFVRFLLMSYLSMPCLAVVPYSTCNHAVIGLPCEAITSLLHSGNPHATQAGSKAQNRFVQAKITSLPNKTPFFQTQFSETVFQSVQMKVICPVA